MRFLIVSCLFFFIHTLSVVGQDKENNHIILWDVTASMVGSTPSGYNEAGNIDKSVRNSLKQLISSFDNDNSTIRILPFTTDILDNAKVFRSNTQGKANAIDFINSYVIDPQIRGYTNICAAYDKAHEFVDRSKASTIYLYTDGEQNIAYGPEGRNCLQSLIDRKCVWALNSLFTYFISINANNRVTFPPGCGIAVPISHTGTGPFIYTPSCYLKPQTSSSVINLQEGLSKIVRFKKSFSRNLRIDFSPTATISFGNSSYSLDVTMALKRDNSNSVDFELNFDDFTRTTISQMKRVTNLNEAATITFFSADSTIKFDPPSMQMIFRYERPRPVQKVNIKID